MINKVSRNQMRVMRHSRVRSKIEGTTELPRLCVFRSNKNISCQVIDDETGTTLASATSLQLKNGGNIEGAKAVGADIAKKATKAGIKEVVFDRGGYQYHGSVQALAEAARENGLDF
jgi:large subunit ribosomal protein L18